MANQVAIAARCEIDVRDIEYRRHGGAALLARLYRPRGDGPFPALVEVHGGAWASGDRLNNAPLDAALAKSGIAQLVAKQREALSSILARVDNMARERLNRKFR